MRRASVSWTTLLFGLVSQWGSLRAEGVPASARTARCSAVLRPEVLVVRGYGRVKLLGVRAPRPSAQGYDRALAASQKFALGKSVKVAVCPVRGRSPEGAVRAMVYYNEGGTWYNLNTKLLRAGLASVLLESSCHIRTKDWVTLVQEARTSNRGLFGDGVQLVESCEEVVPQAPSAYAQQPKAGSKTAAMAAWAGKYEELVPSEATVRLVGNVHTKTFHRLNCVVAPTETNRVYFPARLQAIKAGYKPCFICRP